LLDSFSFILLRILLRIVDSLYLAQFSKHEVKNNFYCKILTEKNSRLLIGFTGVASIFLMTVEE